MNSVAAVILETIRQTKFGKHLKAKQIATYTKLIGEQLNKLHLFGAFRYSLEI